MHTYAEKGFKAHTRNPGHVDRGWAPAITRLLFSTSAQMISRQGCNSAHPAPGTAILRPHPTDVSELQDLTTFSEPGGAEEIHVQRNCLQLTDETYCETL